MGLGGPWSTARPHRTATGSERRRESTKTSKSSPAAASAPYGRGAVHEWAWEARGLRPGPTAPRPAASGGESPPRLPSLALPRPPLPTVAVRYTNGPGRPVVYGQAPPHRDRQRAEARVHQDFQV